MTACALFPPAGLLGGIRPRRRWAGTVALTLTLLYTAPSAALDPPPADSVAALRARIALTVDEVRAKAAGVGLDPSVPERLAVCARLAEDAGDAPDCREALVATHAALRSARAETSDALVRAVADRLATQVSATLSLLAWLRDAPGPAARGDPLAPRGRHPAAVAVAEDGRTLAVEPLRALRGGREYVLVLEGIDAAGAVAGESPEVERRLLEERFAGATAGPPLPRVLEFVEQLDALGPGGEETAAFASVRLTLPAPLRSADLGSLRASFVPARRAPEQGVVARVRTLDATADLAAARAALRAKPCAPLAVESTGDARAETAPLSFAGDVPTLDPASPLEEARLRTTLWLPRDFADGPPLVVLLDGHRGSAERMLDRHGRELLERGLAVLSFDLPGHGVRAAEGDFVRAEDPGRLRGGMRQAAVDLLAVVRAARCGFTLPDGRPYRPGAVRFLGYSLGAMVGVLARATEPDLGTAVFLAPGGDLFGWLMLRLGPALGARFVACLGGPEHGETCIDDGACAPPGRCITDPFFQGLHETIESRYRRATAAGDPLSFATHRTGTASHAPLLLITGGNDAVLHPALATRLADAYGMRVVAPHRRRGPGATLVQWPHLGHDLHERAEVRRQAHEFLASDGRRILPAETAGAPETPGWYRVFGRSRS